MDYQTKLRYLPILPGYEDKIFSIYNGKIFIQLKITKDMIGHKLGEFIFSKKRPIFKSKKKKK